MLIELTKTKLQNPIQGSEYEWSIRIDGCDGIDTPKYYNEKTALELFDEYVEGYKIFKANTTVIKSIEI